MRRNNGLNVHLHMCYFVNDSRIFKEACSLIKLGIFSNIELVGIGKNDLPEKQIFNDGIVIFRMSRRRAGILGKVYSTISWWFAVLLRYYNRKIDCINCHSIYTLPMAIILKTFTGAKLVYDTHELETETNGLGGFRKIILKLFERLGIKFVDRVFVVSKYIARQYAIDYGIPEPVVIYNCPKYRKDTNKYNKFRESFGIAENVKIFLYQGVLGAARGINLMLDSYEYLQGRPIAFIFMGYGPLEEKVKFYSEKYSGIFFQPAVSPDVLLDYTASADIGISVNPITCLSYDYSMPNKLFEFMMAGLPVLVANNKEMSEFVSTYNVGVVMKEHSVQSLVDSIDSLLSQDLNMLSHNSLNVAKEYNWESQESKLVDAYREIF